MNEREKQDTNPENELTDLEPKDDVTGGNTTIGAPQLSRESNLTYSGESGGLNEPW